MNEQDKKLCERLLETNEDGSLVEITEDEQRSAAQAIERLSAEKAEILCLVHRDGGHYIAQHGIEKAFTDALTTIYKWRDAFDELAPLRAQLAEQEPVGEVGENDRILWADARTAVDVDHGTKLYLHPAEDAKDAARYRWLREQHGKQMPVAAVVWKKGSIPSSAIWCDMIDAADLDKHIDAAIDKAMDAPPSHESR